MFRVHDDALVLKVQNTVQQLLTLIKEFHLSECDPYLRFNANWALTGFNIFISFCNTFQSDCRFTRLHDVLDLGVKPFSDRCFVHREDQFSMVDKTGKPWKTQYHSKSTDLITQIPRPLRRYMHSVESQPLSRHSILHNLRHRKVLMGQSQAQASELHHQNLPCYTCCCARRIRTPRAWLEQYIVAVEEVQHWEN